MTSNIEKANFNLSGKINEYHVGENYFGIKDVKEFVKILKDFIMCKVDLEDRDKEYHQIINKIDELAGDKLNGTKD